MNLSTRLRRLREQSPRIGPHDSPLRLLAFARKREYSVDRVPKSNIELSGTVRGG